jgi:CubicO group peptidase (beta-lactamase class C family)
MSTTRKLEPMGPKEVARAAIDVDRVTKTVCSLARKHRIPGAQVAIRHGDVTMAVEVGELEHETGRPVSSDAAFPIGSITKSFTATVAMILVADGEIELDVPIGEYLPELSNGPDDIGLDVTLGQLLSHTSGLPEGPEATELQACSLRRYVAEHCRLDNLVVPPGTFFSYSNIGYVLVGHLTEVITGMTWWEAMESILLRPLGIEPTLLRTPGPHPVGRPVATGHSVNPSTGRIRPVEQSLALCEMPCGGLAVSAVDLVTFALMHLGATRPLLPPEYAERMRQPVPGAGAFGLADGWGLGLATFFDGDTVWFGHDGNADGTACYLRVEPVTGSAVALTSNANVGLPMWRDLVSELRHSGLAVADYSTVKTLARPTPPPPGCLGTFLNGDTEYSVTAGEDGDVCLVIDGDLVARLVLHEGLVFSQEDPASGQRMHAGRFLRDPITGGVDRIQVNGRLARRPDRTDEASDAGPPGQRIRSHVGPSPSVVGGRDDDR